MWPLAACSLVAVAVAVERSIFFWQQVQAQKALLAQAQALVNPGGIDRNRLRAACASSPCQLARVIERGLSSPTLRTALVEGSQGASAELERFLPALDTIVTMAPLLGLFGTVTGMIRSFGIISASGLGHPTEVTGGIAEALIATAAGLAIAIFALFWLSLFRSRAEALRVQMEQAITRLLGTVEVESADLSPARS